MLSSKNICWHLRKSNIADTFLRPPCPKANLIFCICLIILSSWPHDITINLCFNAKFRWAKYSPTKNICPVVLEEMLEYYLYRIYFEIAVEQKNCQVRYRRLIPRTQHGCQNCGRSNVKGILTLSFKINTFWIERWEIF